MRLTVLFVSVTLGVGLLGCGDDAADAIGVMCDKMAECQMLTPETAAFLGSNAAECKQKMSQSSAGGQTAPTKDNCPNTDFDACISAYKSITCDALRSGTSPEACACKK